MMLYLLKADKSILKNADEFLFADSNMGIFLTFFGILATLFSAFTLQGMPNFFARHGVGAWIFLGISDVVMGGAMMYFGLKFRYLVRSFSNNPKNITEILKSQNYHKIIIFFYLVCVSVFLIPYITIQIKGVAYLFDSIFGMGHLFWSCIMVGLMFFYSSFGGIKAIFVTDSIQGAIMLVVIWTIAFFVLKNSGGIENLFLQVHEQNKALLSLPGPSGVLNWQFLVISFISIVSMPFVQPQLTTRILIAKTDMVFIKASFAFCVFAILVILPTVFIGFRGSLIHEGDFLLYILRHDIPSVFYALFVVGVLSASMSTSDSQLMAIGTEWGSFLSLKDLTSNKNAKILVKSMAFICAVISLVLAQSSFKSLVLFSINSFIGTSFLIPIIYSLHAKKGRSFLIFISFFCISVFTAILLGFVPKYVFELRLELFLYALMFLAISFVRLFNESTNISKDGVFARFAKLKQ